MPRHLGYDGPSVANLFEDLGEGRDGMAAYGGEPIARAIIAAVVDCMTALHSLPTPFALTLSNRAMRQLNALHIFDFPLDPNNGFDLDAITRELQACANELKHDRDFSCIVASMRSGYRSDRSGVLLHGGLYPGSWLDTERGLFIIDPEFCWIGPPERDVGILCAHLQLSGQHKELESDLITRYAAPLNPIMLNRFKGIEIMRRLIGVAQLPLDISLEAKAALLADARSLVIGKGQ
jgi:5-methylthioribose kinase